MLAQQVFNGLALGMGYALIGQSAIRSYSESFDWSISHMVPFTRSARKLQWYSLSA